VSRRDPFTNAEALIRDLYAYVAYRVSDPSQAEEITSAGFERAVCYRRRRPGQGKPDGLARRDRPDPNLRAGEECG
jgi:DNA-directed RNA polymerase specialized sigma24 family protein